MTESRIALLATLPMLIGAALVLGLQRPPLTVVQPSTEASPIAEQVGGKDVVAKPYPGVIVSGYTADVGVEIGGSVVEVLARTGGKVQAGDALLRIDPRTAGDDLRVAQARLSQQRSTIERASAELAEAEDLLKRFRSITDGVAERTLVAAETRAQQARAAVQEAKAGLGMQQAQIDRQRTHSDKHVIRAPFEGVVVALYVDPGDVAVPGQVVARVITEDYYVRFALPPDDTAGRMPGLALSVLLPSGETLPAEVTDVQPEVDAAAQLVFARARLLDGSSPSGDVRAGAKPQQALIPGTQVQVTLADVSLQAVGAPGSSAREEEP
jgi:RND family efflux transporter MFP subunit